MSSLVFPSVPHLFIVVLTCVPLGSPSVRHCPHLCSPWFPICLSLSSFVFPLVHHLFIVVLNCVPLDSPSVYRCPQLCSPWFPIMLPCMCSFFAVIFPLVSVFPLVPHLFIVVLSCVPLGSSSCMCSFSTVIFPVVSASCLF